MARRLLLGVLMLGMFAAMAHAGIYVGASIGQQKLNVDDPSFNFSESDSTYKIYGGWMLMKFFGIEGSYVDFGAPKDEISPGVDATIDITAWDAFAVGRLPLGKHIEIFGKAGLLFWNSDTEITGIGSDSDSGNDPAYGVGIGFKLGKHLNVRAEYERFDVSDIDSLYLTSAGADFRF